MKKLMTGDEAIARGVFEAGVKFAAAYPGTPSTEILENLLEIDRKYLFAEWAPNEKVALESAIGASVAGARSFASMKHVGLNVAADPFFTAAYSGVNGGLVIVSADEPGQFSSQNEQDNRNMAKAAFVPMFEPSDSEDCRVMVKEAYELSEKYDAPILIRMTTRVCHSKGLVEIGERKEVGIKKWEKNPQKYVMVPANAKVRKQLIFKRFEELKEYSNNCKWNFIEYNDTKIGVIASGDCYLYAQEVFGKEASYLKVGFSNPLPDKLFKEFAEKVDKIYVIEENDPIMEQHIKALGIECHGKDIFPSYGEMIPEVIREAVYGKKIEPDEEVKEIMINRAPTFCAGCPHRGFFYTLGKRKNIMISGDIGCYTLSAGDPYKAMDMTLCMGASVSMGHGAAQVFSMDECEQDMKVVSVLGDSTFFHSGITSLIDVVYNNSSAVTCILDNRITGMTGQQQNPGTGFTAQGEISTEVDIEALVRAIGVKNVRRINPNNLDEVNEAFDWALALDEPSVIITWWPCALKKQSEEDKKNFPGSFKDKFQVDEDKCIGCRKCTKTGCPAISFKTEIKKSSIDPNKCVGCSVCAQVCPVGAIGKVVK
ncbi:indolepyruvate ferredoxin oxidoreductase subunit alpha [Peptostreptococcus equinus]|uniref:Indolepyruvate oxidoreductase subunit IorA n=1 Tax=Peptostreptococcus equinus TaxID=3003601 RepID=A0ABY7JTB1_9FIRM|nr:indolepyruvate ferredoxin oxidoreductase subunit alpha [Peptostreptococcus sp. CBA3647]WAW15719.1 indolepyruvate ferredoxin oxidoreductase subunit alpha [Peptostreptococcus sp. CBA3647]